MDDSRFESFTGTLSEYSSSNKIDNNSIVGALDDRFFRHEWNIVGKVFVELYTLKQGSLMAVMEFPICLIHEDVKSQSDVNITCETVISHLSKCMPSIIKKPFICDSLGPLDDIYHTTKHCFTQDTDSAIECEPKLSKFNLEEVSTFRVFVVVKSDTIPLARSTVIMPMLILAIDITTSNACDSYGTYNVVRLNGMSAIKQFCE